MKLSRNEKLATLPVLALAATTVVVGLDHANVFDVSDSFNSLLAEATQTKSPSYYASSLIYRDWQKASEEITGLCDSISDVEVGLNYSELQALRSSKEYKINRRSKISNMTLQTDQLQAEIEDTVFARTGLDVDVDAATTILCDTERLGEESVYKNVLGFSDNAWPNETTCMFAGLEPADGEGVDLLNWSCSSPYGADVEAQTVYMPAGGLIGNGPQMATTQ